MILVGGSLVGIWNGWGYGIAFFRARFLPNFGGWNLAKIALSAEFQGFSCKFRPLNNIFRTLENGHSMRHQSIPPLSAGQLSWWQTPEASCLPKQRKTQRQRGMLAIQRWDPNHSDGLQNCYFSIRYWENRSRRNLTFFHADFGKEFPSRNLWRGPSRNCPSPSSALCLLLYRTEHFSRGRKGQIYAEKRGGRGVARKGGKKEKRTRGKQVRNCFQKPKIGRGKTWAIVAILPACYRGLSGPSGPKCLRECPGECPRKRECPTECPTGCFASSAEIQTIAMDSRTVISASATEMRSVVLRHSNWSPILPSSKETNLATDEQWGGFPWWGPLPVSILRRQGGFFRREGKFLRKGEGS